MSSVIMNDATLMTSVGSFLFSCSTYLTSVFIVWPPSYQNWHELWPCLLAFVISNIANQLIFKNAESSFLKPVSLRACNLGNAFSFGLILHFSSLYMQPFGVYLAALAFFHWSEFVTLALTSPQSVKLDSFLLSHSREYHIAAVASWIEFVIELYIFPHWKIAVVPRALGFAMMAGGEVLRKVAMLTAGNSFTHLIQYHKRKEHVLVTDGVYGIFRHPSYIGWFYWSVGSQLLLANPICSVAYAAASWTFFKDRIEHEEETLVALFGEDYIEYQKNVGIGLPGIYGYVHKNND